MMITYWLNALTALSLAAASLCSKQWKDCKKEFIFHVFVTTVAQF